MGIDEIAPDVDIAKELEAEEKKAPEVSAETKTPEKTPEAKETPKEQPKEEKKETMVPHGALHEEREKRKQLAAELKAAKEEQAEYRRKLEERISKLQNPPQKVPTFEEDPATNLRHEVHSVRQEIEPVKQIIGQFQQSQQHAQVVNEITARTVTAETEFAKTTPDYVEAVNFMKARVDANLQAMGIEDPAQRLMIIQQQSLGIAQKALSLGKNPAAVAYDMAKNYGYQGKQKPEDPEKKIETIEKGQKATPSMPSGGKKESPLSLTALEAMDDDEFNKIIDDPVQWRKLISQS